MFKIIICRGGLEQPSALTLLGFGAISTTCGQIVAYPLQLVRTRLQAQGMGNASGGYLPEYTGILDCMKKTVRSFGVRGLYAGIGANFAKALPAVSISYTVFERTRDKLNNLS